MATNPIERGQQSEQGVTIGTQGNEDMNIPGSATHGSHQSKDRSVNTSIPNQDRSSAANQDKANNQRESQ